MTLEWLISFAIISIFIFFLRFYLFEREKQIVTEIARESTSGEEREK